MRVEFCSTVCDKLPQSSFAPSPDGRSPAPIIGPDHAKEISDSIVVQAHQQPRRCDLELTVLQRFANTPYVHVLWTGFPVEPFLFGCLHFWHPSPCWKLERERRVMNKAKLIKKDSPLQEQLRQARKTRRSRGKRGKVVARNAFEVTTEWLKNKREQTPSAREAFAALFTTDPQSA